MCTNRLSRPLIAVVLLTLGGCSAGAKAPTPAVEPAGPWSKAFRLDGHVTHVDTRTDGTLLLTVVGNSGTCGIDIGVKDARLVACLYGGSSADGIAGPKGSTFFVGPHYRGDG